MVVKTILCSANAGGPVNTASTVEYWTPGAGPATSTTTEANAQVKVRTPGTLSNLYVRVTANTGTHVLKTRKNAANGNQTVTVNATGVFEDNTNTDSIAAADLFCYTTDSASNTFTWMVISNHFDATTDTVSILVAWIQLAQTTASTTWFIPLTSRHNTNVTTETNMKTRMRKAGTLKFLGCHVQTNRAQNTTIRLRKNGANGNQVLTITGGAGAAFYEDTTNTDTVTAGEDWNYSEVTGTGSDTLQLNHIKCEFLSTNGDGASTSGDPAGSAVTDNTTGFFSIGGRCVSTTTENNAKVKAKAAFDISNVGCVVSQNDVSSAATFKLRKNGADVTNTVSVTGNTPGVYVDTTHTDTIADGDDLNTALVVPAVAGTHTVTLMQTFLTTHITPLTRISKSFIYPYNIQQRIQKAFIYPANVQKRISKAFIYPANVLQRITKSVIYPSNILKRITKSFIYPANVLKRIQKPFIYPSNVLKRISKSFVYPANVLRKVGAICLKFDGGDDYVDLGARTALWSKSLTKFSFAIRINPSALFDIGYRNILAIGDTNDECYLSYVNAANSSTGNNVLELAVTNDGYTSTGYATTNVANTVDTWYTVIGTYDKDLASNNLKLYVNKSQVGQANYVNKTLVIAATAKLLLGRYENDSPASFQFKGLQKDFRWWSSVALTQTQVDKVTDNDPNAPAPDYWLKMTEASGDPVDSIGGSLTGSLTGGTIWAYSAPTVWLGKAFVYSANVLQRVSKSFVYPANILKRISKSFIYPANVVARVQKAFVYPANILRRLGYSLIKFDSATNDYVDLGNQAGLWSQALSKFTFSFWIYPQAGWDGADRRVVQHGVATNGGFGSYISGTVTGRMAFRLRNAAGTTFTATKDTLTLNAWNHVVCRFDGTLGTANMRIYLDSVGGGTANDTESPNLSTPLRLSDTGAHFKGYMKDFRFWLDALDQTAITKVFNNDADAPAPNYWLKMQEGSGSPVDAIGGSLTGTLTNSAAWINATPPTQWIGKQFKYVFNVVQRVSKSFIYPSNILKRIQKAFVYPANVVKRVQKAFVYPSNILKRISKPFIYPANVVARVQKAFIYPFNIVEAALTRVEKAFIYPFNVVQRTSLQFRYPANITVRVTKSFIYPSNVVKRVQKAFQYPANITSRVTKSFIYPANIQKRITKSFIYPANILKRISKPFIYPANVVKRVQKAFVYPANIVHRTSKQFVYPANITVRVVKTFQYPFNVVKRVQKAFVYPFNVESAVIRIEKAFIYSFNVLHRTSLQFRYPSNITTRVTKSFIYPANIQKRISKAFVYPSNIVHRTSKAFVYPANITVRVIKSFIYPANITVRVQKPFGFKFNVVGRVRKAFRYVFNIVAGATIGLEKDPHLLILDIVRDNWPADSPPLPKKADVIFGQWPNNQGDMLVITEETPTTTIVDDTLDLQANVNANISKIKIHVYVKSFNILSQTATYQPQSDPTEMMDMVSYIENFIDKNPQILLSQGIYEIEQTGTDWDPRRSWRDDLFHAEVNVIMRYVE